jgi:hypothetical protein
MTDAAPAAPPAPVGANAAPPGAVPAAAAVVPPALSVAEALGGTATRLCLLAVPWLFVLTGSGLPFTVAGTAALAGLYAVTCVLMRPPRRPGAARGLSTVADLLAMLVLLAVPLPRREGWSWLVLTLLAALGVLRGLADQSRRALVVAGTPALPRSGPGLWLAAGLAGAGTGLVAGWLGLSGAVWLVAMAMAACAALVAVAAPVPRAAPATERWPRSLGGGVADLARDRLTRVLAGTLLVTGALLQAAGVLLIPAWVRDVLHAPGSLGVVGGATLVGALLARAWRDPNGGARAGGRAAWAVLAGAYLLVGVPAAVGYGHGPHRLPDILLTGALAAGSAALGLAAGATAPGPRALADPLLPPGRRARVAGLVGAVALLGVPAGGLAGGFIATRVGFTAAVACGAGFAALALLAPVAGYRAWRHADRTERSAAPAGTGEVVSVTVGYADGEWTVEIDSGRRRLVSRQAIKPAEALEVVDLLDVPGLHGEVEQTVAADQDYARQHAEELRGELDQLETRMAGMSALIELSELRRATD